LWVFTCFVRRLLCKKKLLHVQLVHQCRTLWWTVYYIHWNYTCFLVYVFVCKSLYVLMYKICITHAAAEWLFNGMSTIIELRIPKAQKIHTANFKYMTFISIVSASVRSMISAVSRIFTLFRLVGFFTYIKTSRILQSWLLQNSLLHVMCVRFLSYSCTTAHNYIDTEWKSIYKSRISYVHGFSPEWTRMFFFFKSPFYHNVSPLISHLWGFKPVRMQNPYGPENVSYVTVWKYITAQFT
jgi:hypothetical protein